MTTEQTVKCRYCHKDILKSKAYNPNPKMYYCDKECYEMSETKNKKKYKPEKGSERRQCTDYIKELYLSNGYEEWQLNQSFWAMIGSQLSNIINEYNTKYSAIKYTLWYMVNIKGMSLFDNKEGTILNLVPFYIDEAKYYWLQTDLIKKAVDDFDFEDNVKVIKKGVDKRTNKWYNQIKVEDLI